MTSDLYERMDAAGDLTAVESVLLRELGSRAYSWLHDVDEYESHPLYVVQAFIPGTVEAPEWTHGAVTA